MSKHEFRVRPVVRYSVTMYQPPTSGASTGAIGHTGCSIKLCELDNEQHAEMLQAALDYQHAPRQYICVKHSFEIDTQVLYFETEQAASDFVAEMLTQEEDWRIFSREVTDPVQRLAREMRA